MQTVIQNEVASSLQLLFFVRKLIASIVSHPPNSVNTSPTYAGKGSVTAERRAPALHEDEKLRLAKLELCAPPETTTRHVF